MTADSAAPVTTGKLHTHYRLVCEECGASVPYDPAAAVSAHLAVTEAARIYLTACDVARAADWPDNSPALLQWAADEDRLRSALVAALEAAK